MNNIYTKYDFFPHGLLKETYYKYVVYFTHRSVGVITSQIGMVKHC